MWPTLPRFYTLVPMLAGNRPTTFTPNLISWLVILFPVFRLEPDLALELSFWQLYCMLSLVAISCGYVCFIFGTYSNFRLRCFYCNDVIVYLSYDFLPLFPAIRQWRVFPYLNISLVLPNVILVIFRLSTPLAFHLVVVGVLIPISTSCLLMLLIYCCCIRKSYVQDTVPLSPSIFNPLNEPQLPSYSSYGAIGDVDDGWIDGGSFADHIFPARSSRRGVPRTHSNFTFRTGEGIFTTTTTLKNTFCCCCYSRRSNQYRLWRLARLAPVLSAVLLLTSLFVGSILSMILYV